MRYEVRNELDNGNSYGIEDEDRYSAVPFFPSLRVEGLYDANHVCQRPEHYLQYMVRYGRQ